MVAKEVVDARLLIRVQTQLIRYTGWRQNRKEAANVPVWKRVLQSIWALCENAIWECGWHHMVATLVWVVFKDLFLFSF